MLQYTCQSLMLSLDQKTFQLLHCLHHCTIVVCTHVHIIVPMFGFFKFKIFFCIIAVFVCAVFVTLFVTLQRIYSLSLYFPPTGNDGRCQAAVSLTIYIIFFYKVLEKKCIQIKQRINYIIEQL